VTCYRDKCYNSVVWNVRPADVVPPKLVCPRDLDVTVAYWSDNSTIVHYDIQRPQIGDNSGHFDYRVVGVPNRQLRFPVGFVALTYEAFDVAGNTASCVQYIRVRGLSQIHSRMIAMMAAVPIILSSFFFSKSPFARIKTLWFKLRLYIPFIANCD